MSLDEIIHRLDEEEYGEETGKSLDALVRKTFTLDDGETWEGVEVGGVSRWAADPLIGTTPELLYRALWLFGPNRIDFEDMYKCFLFGIVSPCKQFMVAVELFKYEFCLVYWCARGEDVSGRRSVIIAGCPGLQKGIRCSNPEGLKFFALIRRLVECKWMVYGGNDFAV